MTQHDPFFIRPLKSKDAVGMLEWMSDPKIVQYFRFDAAGVTIETCHAFIDAANQSADARHYAIVDAQDEYLGTVSLKHIDANDSSAEYAISMRACAHGSGAAQVGTEAVLRIAFCELRLERVYLNVLADNKRANAFYRKMKFEFERIEKQAVQIRGTAYDLNWYVRKREAVECL